MSASTARLAAAASAIPSAVLPKEMPMPSCERSATTKRVLMDKASSPDFARSESPE